jgi:hypothetical protein
LTQATVEIGFDYWADWSRLGEIEPSWTMLDSRPNPKMIFSASFMKGIELVSNGSALGY